VAAPMPRLAPVINTTCPCNRVELEIFFLLSLDSSMIFSFTGSVCHDTMIPGSGPLNQNGDYPGIKTDRIGEEEV
jgi:hypothetical protein